MFVTIPEINIPLEKRKCHTYDCPLQEAVQALLKGGLSCECGSLNIRICKDGKILDLIPVPPAMAFWMQRHDDGFTVPSVIVQLEIDKWVKTTA
jgi:hypothetical protein